MIDKTTINWRNAAIVLLATALVSAFLLLCIQDKMLADISAGNWRKIASRTGLIVLAGFLVALRFEAPIHINRSTPLRTLRNLFLALIFLSVLFYPIASQLPFLTKSIREVKHTVLKNQTTLTEKIVALAKNFPKEFEKYAGSNLYLPKSFIHLQALIKVYCLGISPNPNTALGKNGFYYEGWGASRVEKSIVEKFDNIADYMGQAPFSKADLRQWKRALEQRRYWLKEQGIEFVFVLVPTKALVYPEYLPTNLQNIRKGSTRYDQLTEFLRASSDIHFIDMLPHLLRAKEAQPYPLLFYKTDVHWNFFGAFIAYQAIIDELREMFPHYNLRHPELSEFDLSINKHWAHYRFVDMVGLPVSLHKNEHYITLVPKPGGRYDSALDLPPKGISDVFPPEKPVKAADGTSMNLRLIENPKAPLSSMLLLGDSFLEKCVYFFSADAKRVLNHRTVVNFPDYILRYEKPDIVIQEILNMFILREPPNNPRELGPAYLRGKFADTAGNVVVTKTRGDFVARESGDKKVVEVVLPNDPNHTEEEMRIARFTLSCQKAGRIDIRLYDAADKEVSLSAHAVTEGTNTLMFEMPSQKIARMTFTGQGGTNLPFTPESLQINSDAAFKPAR
ncbi:MAG: hypothetical protein OEL83_14595 [Desulforhopalus sp.]|nr:hypothetical protein [Desulforhopalus sp.]